MFVAGDVEQFEQYRDTTNGTQPFVTIEEKENVWLGKMSDAKAAKTAGNEELKIVDVVENTDLPIYRTLAADAVDNTFFYMFDKFKKGVFVKIKNNQLAAFLPFSKHNFVNEWSHRIRYDTSRFVSMNQFLDHASKIDGSGRSARFNYNIEEWYANNGMFRNEYPLTERDRNLDELRDMLQHVCASRAVPDIEFFLNRRDYPLLCKKGFEPYDHIYDADNVALKSHVYGKYAPVLSMVTTDRHADIPVPTHEDWARVSSVEGDKVFARDYRYTFEMDWDRKKACAVFRGASTGIGVTHEQEVNVHTFNPRLFAAKLSADLHQAGRDILDAGITEWNTRPRKIRGEPYLRTVEVDTLGLSLVDRISPEQQSMYKYILNLDGHVSAFRLSLELSMGSVVLLQEHTPGMTNYRMWYHRSLIPFVHYVPVRRDLSDLVDKIEWCILHDDECRKIAQNALAFYHTYLTRDGVLDYWQYLLARLKQTVGMYLYNTVSVEKCIADEQSKWLSEILPSSSLAPPQYVLDKSKYTFDFRNVAGKEALRSVLTPEHCKPRVASYTSESTTIQRANIGTLHIAVKTLNHSTATVEKRHQLINEAFVGLACINKLCDELPNFRYTFGLHEQNEVLITEFVPGVTWDKFIEKCSVEEMLHGLMQIFLSLMVAQERCGFVHNDLNGWNIVVRQLAQPIEIAYAFRDRVIRMTTSQVCVLIDYGRSHVIHLDRHYGQVHPFKFSPIQDCFCLIVCTMFLFVSGMNSTNEFLNIALDAVNFFTGTNFHPSPIRDKTRLIKFLKQHKKYNEMLYAPKNSIEKYTPLHLFDHFVGMHKRLNLGMPFEVVMYPKKCVSTRLESAPPFAYLLALTNQLKKLPGMIKQFEQEMAHFLTTEEAPHPICALYSLNAYARLLNGLDKFVKTCAGVKCDRELASARRTLDTLAAQAVPVPTPIVERLPPRQTLVIPRYTPRTFAIPSRLLTVLQSYLTRPTSMYAVLHDVAVQLFLFDQPIRLPEKEELAWVKKNRKLFTFDTIASRVNCANVCTIQWMSQLVYPEQLQHAKNNTRLEETYKQVMTFQYNDEEHESEDDLKM
jgi:hypothetical protein